MMGINNWTWNKDEYDLTEFNKAIRKEIRKALKPVKEYIKRNNKI